MQTVGDILRAAREKQGVSIKDVEKATSIRALYIQAIEEGNYKIMPGEVYLKGFIRNYANFLGLNGQEMVELYRQSLPAPAVALETEKADNRRKISSGRSKAKWPIVIPVIVVIAGCWLAWSFLHQQPPDLQTKPAPQSQPAPQAATPAPSPTPSTPAVPAPQPSITPGAQAAKPVVVVAKYAAQSWTLVTADGKEIYEGTPKKGDSFTWSADQNVTIKLGNAAAVDVTFNGQPQAKIGAEGEVVIKTFSAGSTTIKKP